MYFISPTTRCAKAWCIAWQTIQDQERHLCPRTESRDSVDNALAQIDSKGYAISYEADGRTITKCGVTISSEARNITHWRAVDNEGKVIEEQKYEWHLTAHKNDIA